MKYGHHLHQISFTPLKTLLVMILTLNKDKLNMKILLHVILVLSMLRQCIVCLRTVGDHTVKILKFGTPQTIAIIVLKIERFDVTLH